MSRLHFSPLEGRTEEIIQAVMDTSEVKAVPSLDFTLHLAVEELVVNIVNYAYPAGVAGKLDINVTADEKKVSLEFIDSGLAFNPLEAEAPDITLGIRERPIGGLGIFLTRQMMDEMAYRREDGCNILTATKYT